MNNIHRILLAIAFTKLNRGGSKKKVGSAESDPSTTGPEDTGEDYVL